MSEREENGSGRKERGSSSVRDTRTSRPATNSTRYSV